MSGPLIRWAAMPSWRVWEGVAWKEKKNWRDGGRLHGGTAVFDTALRLLPAVDGLACGDCRRPADRMCGGERRRVMVFDTASSESKCCAARRGHCSGATPLAVSEKNRGGFVLRYVEAVSEARTFEPELLVSHEVGIKWRGFDNRVRTNAAAFLADYESV